MTSKISAFMHVEMVHPDPRAAGAFLTEIFGAEQVETNISSFIEQMMPGVEVVHMKMGNVVFQIVKPNEALATWHQQLAARGPGIHNVSMQVDDLEGIRAALLAKGCKQTMDFTVDMRPAGVKSTGPITGYVIDAFEQSGVRFELVPTALGYEPVA